METRQIRTWFIFWVSLVLAFFLIWFGLRLLIWDSSFSSETYFILSLATILGGVLSASPTSSPSLMVSGSLIGIGVYFFARSEGLLQLDWLSVIAGLAAFLAASLVVFIAFPRRSQF